MTGESKKDSRTGLEIAVIGMAARLPGANHIHEFWNNLINGVESISFLSEEELKEFGVTPGALGNANFVKAMGGVIENKEYFDAAFFDYTPREAEIMDPQTRIFHECAWQALEDAGYNTESCDQSIGLFAGGSFNFYWECLAHLSGKAAQLGDLAALTLINKDFLNTRVSYKLDLQGPCTAVQTACSTSLVAVHMACRALLTGECKLALAGGVSIWHQARAGYIFQEGMINSPDGHCRAFDANAKGTNGGDGVGIVVLKRIKEAIADRDHIYALVKGSAVNNDGIRRVGFTAPSVKGQFEVIRAALRFSRVEPGSISYIEAHGTGTALGDPVEIEALKKAYNTDKKAGCAIGAVKTNIGHLDAAAGISGFIKTVLALTHKKIPPSLHFEKPNPKIDFENSWFYVNNKPTEWESNGRPRPLRAGVSSFGQGGTNAHVILEEFPEGTGGLAPLPGVHPSREHQLISLSAKTHTALNKMTENFAEYLQENPTVNLADAAYTLQVGRGNFKFRQKLVCRDVNEAIEALSDTDSRKVQRYYLKVKSKQVVFMFPGIGAQYVNMGLELYQKEPVFREAVDRCFEILKPLMGYDIKEILYPGISVSEVSEGKWEDGKIGKEAPFGQIDAFGEGGIHHKETQKDTKQNINRAFPPGTHHSSFIIHNFEVAQLVTFIFEYALVKLLIKWGIKPDAMIGYSFGEYIAACISGVFSLEDALKLIVHRGELLREMPAGGMMSVPLNKEDIKPFLGDSLSIAIDIGPSCIVSGPEPAIAQLEKQLKEKRIMGIGLKTSIALHSGMMLPICKAFADRVGQVTLNKPDIPYISNVTGQWITTNDAVDPVYWANHLTNTVRFHEGMTELAKEEDSIFIEVGPARDLCTMVERYIADPDKQQAVNLVRPQQSDVSDTYYLLSKIGNLWLYGASMDWFEFYSRQKRQRISLPSYPFEGQRYWISGDYLKGGIGAAARETQLKKKPDIADWFYIPGWKSSTLPARNSSPNSNTTDMPGHTWLVLVDECELAHRFSRQLQLQGMEVTIVNKGPAFERVSDREYIINPKSANDYLALFKELGQSGRLPTEIAHFWGVSPLDREEPENQRIAGTQELGFYSLIYLVRAIDKQEVLHDIHLGVITTNVQEVTGREVLYPEKALVLGVLKVIPQEYPYIVCRTIDIDCPEPGSWQEGRLVTQLIDEFSAKSLDTVAALRNNYRWVQVFEPVRWPKPGEMIPRLRKAGVYLVTGGLGNIGYLLAKNLVKRVGAKLILTGRSAPPPRDEWDQWLNNHKQDDPTSRKIKKIRQLEEEGGEVLVFSVDAGDPGQMQAAISQAEQQFGPINGVIHAAGDTGQSITRPIKQLDETVVNQQFRPKIYGLLTLKKLFGDKELDFCLLISSLSPILGGLGFAAYSAANVFMDAFVYQYNRTKARNWISVNWADWRFSDDVNQDIAFGAAAMELSITPTQGVQTCERILYHCKKNQVVVSAGNLETRIDQWVKLRSLREETPGKKEASPLYQSRPDLGNTYVMPSNTLELSLAEILQDFLGIEKVGIKDNFFEIGATSLNLIQINRELRIKIGKDIPIVDWFEYPTIDRLAKYLEKEEANELTGVETMDRSSVISQGKNKLKYLRRISNEN